MFLTTRANRRLAYWMKKVQDRINSMLSKPEFSRDRITFLYEENLWPWLATLDNYHYHNGDGMHHAVSGSGDSPAEAVENILQQLTDIEIFSRMMPGKGCGEMCKELRFEIVPTP